MAGLRATLVGVRQFQAKMAIERKRWNGAVHAGVKEQTRATQLEVRRHVRAAFGGKARIANAVRSKIYDNKRRGHAGLIWSKFGRRTNTGVADYIAPRLFGATVRPKGGRQFLRIPIAPKGTKASTVRRRGRRLADAGKLKYIPPQGSRPGLLVHQTRSRSTPMFLLIKQVRYRRRTSPRRLLAGAVRGLPKRIRRARKGRG